MPETWVNLMNLNSAHEVSVEGDNPECKTEKMGKYMREFDGGAGLCFTDNGKHCVLNRKQYHLEHLPGESGLQ